MITAQPWSIEFPPGLGSWTKDKVRGEPRTSIAWKLKSVETERLFDVCQRCVQPNNVSSEILAVRGLVLVRTGRLKLVVSAIAVVKVEKHDVVDGCWEQVVRWPHRRRKGRRSCNQGVVAEGKGGETIGDDRLRHVGLGATAGSA